MRNCVSSRVPDIPPIWTSKITQLALCGMSEAKKGFGGPKGVRIVTKRTY
ncbi:hypothetical protein OKW32_002718 [Paraburkholderia youngii]